MHLGKLMRPRHEEGHFKTWPRNGHASTYNPWRRSGKLKRRAGLNEVQCMVASEYVEWREGGKKKLGRRAGFNFLESWGNMSH